MDNIGELTVQDYRNMLAVLERASFNSMNEAEAAVVLKQRVLAKVKDMLSSDEEPNGDDVQATS